MVSKDGRPGRGRPRTGGRPGLGFPLIPSFLLAFLLTGCSSMRNVKVVDIPLSPEEIDEVQGEADDRPGVLYWAAEGESGLHATVVSVTSDSLQYSSTESQTLLWSALGEVSRVEFPHSTGKALFWGVVGGAGAGAATGLIWAAMGGLLCWEGQDCDVDWGGAAAKGALVGSVLMGILGPVLNDIAPPGFEFSVGR